MQPKIRLPVVDCRRHTVPKGDIIMFHFPDNFHLLDNQEFPVLLGEYIYEIIADGWR